MNNLTGETSLECWAEDQVWGWVNDKAGFAFARKWIITPGWPITKVALETL